MEIYGSHIRLAMAIEGSKAFPCLYKLYVEAMGRNVWSYFLSLIWCLCWGNICLGYWLVDFNICLTAIRRSSSFLADIAGWLWIQRGLWQHFHICGKPRISIRHNEWYCFSLYIIFVLEEWVGCLLITIMRSSSFVVVTASSSLVSDTADLRWPWSKTSNICTKSEAVSVLWMILIQSWHWVLSEEWVLRVLTDRYHIWLITSRGVSSFVTDTPGLMWP